jgi:hypothetical protein
MAPDQALFDLPEQAKSDEERDVSAFFDAIERERDLAPHERLTKRMMLALAKSIAEGNRKGRSVASDVERLMDLMRSMQPKEADDTDLDDLTPAERELLNALATVPARHADAPDGYAA